tara:strand:+ start:951 stop:1421 length:471 start_codon:yes stop_codon:yes gene_type:complete
MNWEVDNGKKYSEDCQICKRKKVSTHLLSFDKLNFYWPDSISKIDHEYRYVHLFNSYNKLDTIFSYEEKEFFFEQFKAVKDSVWKHPLEKSKLRDTKSSLNLYSYSIPLFSSSRNYVLIKKSFYCGNVCAYGGIFLYRRVDKCGWELVEVYNGWIS